MDHSDGELIKRTLAGDEAAFGPLVDKYKGAVHALVYRKIGDFHIAEELTQDAFLQAYQKLSTLRNPVHFAGWLYVIASRCCLMWYRKKRLSTSSLAKVETDEMEIIAQRDYRDEHQRQEVRDALDSLPESQRTVLMLHYLGGLSCAEIGRFIGTSEGAIKDRLYRARLRLREEITNMMQETLRGFQLPPTFTRKLLERISNFEPTSTISRGQPLIPWGVAGAVTIALIVCVSFTNGIRFQLPYSFNAEESGTMVEIINAPILDHVPLLPNRRGGGQVVFQAAAQKEQDDARSSLTYQDYQRWHLPEKAKARLGKGTISQGDRVVAFSPDGAYIAVASNIGVWLYDVKTTRELALLTTHSIWGHAVAFSPDGTKLAAADGREIQLWNVSTWTSIATLEGHAGLVWSVAFSPDGTKLASGSIDKTVKLWEVETGRKINTLTGHTELPRSVAFSPDGAKLASGSIDKTVKLWDVSTGENINTLGDTDSTSAAVQMLHIFAGRASKPTRHSSPVTSVAFSPDGTKLAAALSVSQGVKLWEVDTGKHINTFSANMGGVMSVAFSPDSMMLASTPGALGRIKLWEIGTGKNVATLQGRKGWVYSVVFSPDGTKLASGDGHEIKLWDVSTQTSIATLGRHTGKVWSVAFSPDGTKLASGAEDKIVKLWEIDPKRNIATLEGHTGKVYSVVFSPDGTKLASGSEDKTVKLWDAEMGKNIATLEGHRDWVWSVVFSPDGTKLASGSDNTVELWEVETGKHIDTFQGDGRGLTSVAFSPDGTRLASGSTVGTILVWEMSELAD